MNAARRNATALASPWHFVVRDDQLDAKQRRRCLSGPWRIRSKSTAPADAAAGKMHVAFFDADSVAPNFAAMRDASAHLDQRHVQLYAATRVQNASALPGFHFIKLSWLLDHKLHGPDGHWINDRAQTYKKVQCLYNALSRLVASAHGKQTVAKVLLPWLAPLDVRRLLVLNSVCLCRRWSQTSAQRTPTCHRRIQCAFDGAASDRARRMRSWCATSANSGATSIVSAAHY